MSLQYDFFIASRWRNQNIILELLQKLRNKGKTVYCFLENKEQYMTITDNPEETMKIYESTKDWKNDTNARQMFDNDLQGLKDSRVLLLLLPAGKSAHVEAGIAFGLGKECIVIGEQKEAESLYHIFSKMYKTIDEFIADVS